MRGATKRLWVAIVLVSAAGCSASGITADTTCGVYLSSDAGERHAAAAAIAKDLKAYDAGSDVWGAGLDTDCTAASDRTLRAYLGGQETYDFPNVSMEPTLNVGDRVVVSTQAYAGVPPRRGDIVLFNAPPSWSADPAAGARFVKRVIGLGGDHVTCCDPQQRLMVNGHPLDEPYLHPDGPASPDLFDIMVPAGRLWLMGDHRTHSVDSRELYLRLQDTTTATVPADAVLGRAVVVFAAPDHTPPRWLTVPPTYAELPDPPR